MNGTAANDDESAGDVESAEDVEENEPALATLTCHYKVLDVPRDATRAVIQSSYIHLHCLHDPDTGGSKAKQQRVQQAFYVLNDTDQRRAYDNGEDNGEVPDSEDDSSDEY